METKVGLFLSATGPWARAAVGHSPVVRLARGKRGIRGPHTALLTGSRLLLCLCTRGQGPLPDMGSEQCLASSHGKHPFQKATRGVCPTPGAVLGAPFTGAFRRGACAWMHKSHLFRAPRTGNLHLQG